MASFFTQLRSEVKELIRYKRLRLRHEQNLPLLRPEFLGVSQGGLALQKLIDDYDFRTVLDVGSGEGLHSKIFLNLGKDVTAIDYGKSVYAEKMVEDNRLNIIKGDFNHYDFGRKFDCVWASHVLEHQTNPNDFLVRVRKLVKDGGVVAITVPPFKHEIVGGHVTLWNPGLLMYQMVLAGIDCSQAAVLQYGYNISVITGAKSIELPELVYDKGDVDRLARFFPEGTSEPFDGNILKHNW